VWSPNLWNQRFEVDPFRFLSVIATCGDGFLFFSGLLSGCVGRKLKTKKPQARAVLAGGSRKLRITGDYAFGFTGLSVALRLPKIPHHSISVWLPSKGVYQLESFPL
jgi:hypothetical protein